MHTFTKLLSALSLLSVAYFTLEVKAQIPPPANRTTGGSTCSTTTFLLETVMPANINDNGGVPLTVPITTFPVYTGLSVGVQNYTCGADGTWSSIGAFSYLYDISCLPLDTHRAFTSFIAGLWDAAPQTVTAADLVAVTKNLNPGVGLGVHYWVPDPLNATSGSTFAKWDFSQSELMVNDTNKVNAFLVASKTGNVPDPFTPSVNLNWLVESALVVGGKNDGQLADQVFRINTNGGQAPNTSCTPNADTLQVKSTMDFLFYGGAWNDTIF